MIDFGHPWMALSVIPLALLGWYRLRTLRKATILFGPPEIDHRGRHGMEILRRLQFPLEMLLLTLLVFALTDPGRKDVVRTVSETGLDVVLVLDISASMQAADFKPNRLEALKEITRQFLRRAGGNRIAIHAFAGASFTQSPLTTEHRTTLELIDGLNYESIDHGESGGTAIGDALLGASDALDAARIPGRDQVIILISDGESNVGIDPILAARFVRDRKIRLHVIGIGAFEEVQVFVHGEPFINSEDNILMTSLDDTQLRAVAEAGGGDYRRADSEDMLGRIFNDLSRLERTPLKVETTIFRSPWMPRLALALFFVFSAGVIVRHRTRRPLR